MQPDFRLAQGDADHLARICRLTEGMPLGLEMAAAWITGMPLSGIAEEIERGYSVLTTELVDVPDRQRSMQASLGASWGAVEFRTKKRFPEAVHLSRRLQQTGRRRSCWRHSANPGCLWPAGPG